MEKSSFTEVTRLDQVPLSGGGRGGEERGGGKEGWGSGHGRRRRGRRAGLDGLANGDNKWAERPIWCKWHYLMTFQFTVLFFSAFQRLSNYPVFSTTRGGGRGTRGWGACVGGGPSGNHLYSRPLLIMGSHSHSSQPYHTLYPIHSHISLPYHGLNFSHSHSSHPYHGLHCNEHHWTNAFHRHYHASKFSTSQ